MGDCVSKQHQNIYTATLNFSGICLSPFQYHDSSIEKDVMSSTFQKLMLKYIAQQHFSWDVGKIDLRMQKQRYSPVYRKDVCIVNKKLVDKQQFEKLWDLQFQKNKGVLKDFKPKDQQIKQARLFDWISYQTFLNQVYKQNQKHLLDISKIKTFDTSNFQKFLNYWHSQPYLDNNLKMQKTVKFLTKYQIDVLFLQQAQIRQNFNWKDILPQQFDVATRQGSQSIIIYRKNKFPINQKDKNIFQKKYKDQINFNRDTCFLKTQNNYLLISAHLTSKAHNIQQSQEMRDKFQKIIKQNPNIQIICGVDSNHFINPTLYNRKVINKIFHFYPYLQSETTTSKKRTMVQLQSNKANVIVIEPKDHLISTRPLLFSENPKSPWVGMMNGSFPGEKVYLPCRDHPFDHFLIFAEIIQPVIQQNQNQKKK